MNPFLLLIAAGVTPIPNDAAAITARAEGPSFSKVEPSGYEQCHGEMVGHESLPGRIRVCQRGNGTYRDYEKVVQAASSRDWFPKGVFGDFLDEIRIVCSLAPGPAKSAGMVVVFPARSEKGRKARIEIPCQFNSAEVLKTLSLARTTLRQARKSPRTVAQNVARQKFRNCQKSEECRRFYVAVENVLLGKGHPLYDARPLDFSYRGLGFKAGLEPGASADPVAELESLEPLPRLKEALAESNREQGDKRMEEIALDAFNELSQAQKYEFLESAVSDSSEAVRYFASKRLGALPLERRGSAVNKLLEDHEPAVRMQALPWVPELGEFYMLRAMQDPDHRVRSQALDTLVDYFVENKQPEGAVPYLTRALNDPDEYVRAIAHVKLRYFRQEYPDRVPASVWPAGESEE